MSPELLWVAGLLCSLAVVDAAFTGFRSHAGRNASLRKWGNGYYRRACLRGLTAGLLVVALVVGLALGLRQASPGWEPAALRGLLPLLAVCGTYATVVLLAFVPWLSAAAELRVLTSVTVFGPLTLVRPPVVAAGTAIALWQAARWEPCLVIGAACALVMLVEPILGWLGRRRDWFVLEGP